jgi:hypothetical protein
MLGQHAKCYGFSSCVLKGNPSFLPVETEIYVTGSSNSFRTWKYAITSNSGEKKSS